MRLTLILLSLMVLQGCMRHLDPLNVALGVSNILQ